MPQYPNKIPETGKKQRLRHCLEVQYDTNKQARFHVSGYSGASYIIVLFEVEEQRSKGIQMDERHLERCIIKHRDPQVTIRFFFKCPRGAIFMLAESHLYETSFTEGLSLRERCPGNAGAHERDREK